MSATPPVFAASPDPSTEQQSEQKVIQPKINKTSLAYLWRVIIKRQTRTLQTELLSELVKCFLRPDETDRFLHEVTWETDPNRDAGPMRVPIGWETAKDSDGSTIYYPHKRSRIGHGMRILDDVNWDDRICYRFDVPSRTWVRARTVGDLIDAIRSGIASRTLSPIPEHRKECMRILRKHGRNSDEYRARTRIARLLSQYDIYDLLALEKKLDPASQ